MPTLRVVVSPPAVFRTLMDGATSFYTLEIASVTLRRLGLVSFSRQVYLFQVTGTKYLTKQTHRKAYFCSQLEGPILLVETLRPQEYKAAAHMAQQ